MEKELDPLVIKTTQASLGKYVKRPPLNEKLLKKPPFRFLHDIVTSVLKTTGFFEGLFDEEELVSENVKDRENKIVFLNKVITVVGLTTGKPLAVKPSKIVAGQEPEKTNELLQCIAQALDKKLSSGEAVKKFKEGAKLPKPDEKKLKDSDKTAKKTSEVSKLTSKSSDKLSNHKKDAGVRTTNKYENEGKNVSKSKQKEKPSTKTETPPKSTSQPSKLATTKKPSVEKKNTESNEKTLDVNITEAIGEKNTKVDLKVVNDEKDKKMELENQQSINSIITIRPPLSSEPVSIEQNELNNSYTIVDNGLNSSLSSQDLMESNGMEVENNKTVNTLPQKKLKIIENIKNIDQTASNGKNYESLSQNLTEEKKEVVILNKVASSATQNNITSELLAKGEEKERTNAFITRSPSKVNSVARPASVRPSSSRPGAPRPREKHENILTEAENIIVGKVNIIAENSPNEEEEDTSIIITEKETSDSTAAQNEQEQLQGTLNDHGHLVQQILDSQKEYSQMSGKTEIEWQFGAQKARDASNKEVEQLRFDIQALSRVANPLGKLLDHIQEDVEVMRQELSQWTKTYEQTSKELVKQKAANVDSLFPLYAKVKQLDTDVDVKCDKINDLKIIIHKNSLRIEKLLSNGKVQ